MSGNRLRELSKEKIWKQFPPEKVLGIGEIKIGLESTIGNESEF